MNRRDYIKNLIGFSKCPGTTSVFMILNGLAAGTRTAW